MKKYLPFYLVLLFTLSACGSGNGLIPIATLTPSPSATQTSLPMAVIVNGEGITQAEFDAEVARYLLADEELGETSELEEVTQVVLDDFISQLLLVQGAAALGYTVDDSTLQSRIDALAVSVGGADVLWQWQIENGYTEEEFSIALRRQIAVAWMRDKIIADVPLVADQVHVRQIIFTEKEDALNVYALLQSGWDFNTVAGQYNPLTKGELGWFPRGYLVHPTIEEAAFSLQPGTYSPVVESMVGFHILYLIERDPAHPLSPDALLTLQENALHEWLTQRRNESTITYPALE